MDLSILLHGLLVVLYFGRSAAYIEKVLENDSVCSMSFTSNGLTVIGREDQSAMVIRDSRYFQHWTGKHEFNCRFTVSSSLDLGIIAVIQRMSLRRNAEGQCLDYVQFRRAEKTIQFYDLNFKIKSSEDWSRKICGKLNTLGFDNEDDDSFSKTYIEDGLALNSFISNKGVEVKIHLGNKSLEAGEELKFEIVLTSYHDCTHDSGILKSCGLRKCIYKEFFHDGKVNCPYKNCLDENGCNPQIPTYKGGSDRFNTSFGTKIMAGTVAGLFTMFVAFIAFLWLFRHCGTAFCCIGNPNSHPHSSEMQPVPHLDIMAVMATAPPDAMVASSTDVRTADKDLPPSYESLFPSK